MNRYRPLALAVLLLAGLIIVLGEILGASAFSDAINKLFGQISGRLT
jgi:hypothetical protein